MSKMEQVEVNILNKAKRWADLAKSANEYAPDINIFNGLPSITALQLGDNIEEVSYPRTLILYLYVPSNTKKKM